MWCEWGGAMFGGEAGSCEAEERLLGLVFEQLMHETQHGAPGARLSAGLRAALERLQPEARRALVSRRAVGAAPLFVAARRGNAEVVEYLAGVCGAPLEQRGELRARGRVTPLWAAAARGRLAALRALADAGARLDARSDAGSTPLRCACYMTHLDVVRFLCERGADVHVRAHGGGTCLMSGVQCARLTRYLLARGADVDAQDARGYTALHYAIQEHREETARVLVCAGASVRLRSACGEDALALAGARGAAPALALVARAAPHSARALADAHELLGATQLLQLADEAAALAAWRAATDIRHAGARYVAKGPAAAGVARALGGAREWATRGELAALAHDADGMRAQALLVTARVLGAEHRDTLQRAMRRGAELAEAGRLQRCAALWTWLLEARLRCLTLLHHDTCDTLGSLVWVAAEARARGDATAAPHRRVARLLRLVAGAVPECQRLVSERPRCAVQASAWDRALRSLAHVVVLALAGGEVAARTVRAELAALVALQPRGAAGESLLHLVCSRLPSAPDAAGALLPSAAATRALLVAGADARARDHAGRSPLHVAVAAYNYSSDLVEALLSGGAHACSPDARGESALALAPAGARAALGARVTLACRAARALLLAPPPDHTLPRPLRAFLELHRAPPPRPSPAPAPLYVDGEHL